MMPAKSQETPPVTAPSNPDGGFGKVLNSIQGLQQRLDDFSVEDVIRAGSKAETLIHQLSSFEVKLSSLPLLKQVCSDANRIISEIPEENLEPAALSNLEKYPILNALLTIGNQLRQAVLACPERPINPEPPALKALPSRVSQAEPLPNTTTGSATLTDPAPERSIAGGAANITQAAAKARAAKLRPAARAEDSPGTDAASQAASNPLLETLRDEDDVPGKERVSARGNSDIDQRLLDDLIKSYGDFASLSHHPHPQKYSKATPSATAKPESAAVHAPERRATTVETKSPMASLPVPVKAKSSVPVKAAQAKITAVLETKQSQQIQENATTSTRRGEIDRQLKSIVKDYGEYDLYPRDNSSNVKMAGILAFVLLGLVLAGFYLFKAPAPETTAPAHSTVQPEAKSSSGASTATANQSPSSATNSVKKTK